MTVYITPLEKMFSSLLWRKMREGRKKGRERRRGEGGKGERGGGEKVEGGGGV